MTGGRVDPDAAGRPHRTRGTSVAVAAVDLGATSGRVMMGRVGPDELRLEQAARFANGPVRRDDGLHWDYAGLLEHVLDGLRAAGARVAAEGEDAAGTTQGTASTASTASTAADAAGTAGGHGIRSIGIDAWAVDYGLLVPGDDPRATHDDPRATHDGSRLASDPFHYRDERSAAGVDAVHARVPFAGLYAQNGLQFLPFNTLYQLAVDRDAGRLEASETALLIPDLLAWNITGRRVAEATNASTTGLLTLARTWNHELATRLEVPERIFPPLVTPGTVIGHPTPAMRDRLGFDAPVIAVGSHDTASAVVAAPMTEPDAAFISCGTWGLVGVELEHPVVTDAARRANFTNEGGVDGRTRFLRNVMGLWLLNESMNAWADAGLRLSLPGLLDEAAELTGPVPVFDVDDPRFLAPGSHAGDASGPMPERIAGWCREHGEPEPHSPAMVARAIVESLAEAFARTVREASEISGHPVGVIHLVGGGAQNTLLCRLTARRSGLPVVAGPVEATALGNVLVQARALGAFGDPQEVGLDALRALVARATRPVRYEP